MPFGVATKDDRLGERTFGRGFSTGTSKDEQAPYGGATNHGRRQVRSTHVWIWLFDRSGQG